MLLKNANILGANLLDLDYLILSHGHYDHTGGLSSLISLYKKHNKENFPTIICHPDTFCRRHTLLKDLSSPLTEKQILEFFPIEYTTKAKWINDNLAFLGEIPRNLGFGENYFGKIEKNNEIIDDKIMDDSALVYKAKEGLVIIAGCSHSGICNIIEQAKKICGDNRIFDIVGGLHLRSTKKNILKKIVEYMDKAGVQNTHACHCTGKAKKALLRQINIGAGSVICL